MAGEGYQVTPQALTAHASRLDGIADSVGNAKQAGTSVQLGANAYGQLCTMVPLIIGALQGLVISGVDDAIQSLHHTSDQLRTSAATYQGHEEQLQQAFDRLRVPQ
jgi:uncharacterized protein YukE